MLIFYNPPSSALRKPVLPMSLLALGAMLEGEEEYLIIDGNLESDPASTLHRAIEETNADLLAVTVMPGPQLSHAVPQCRQLKKDYPDLTVVWGGYFPTQHYEACLRADYVDYVVRGHGEWVFRDLLAALRNGSDATRLPGMAYRHRRTGEIHANEKAPLPHPDELPAFPYQRVDVSRYLRSTFLGTKTLSHHSSYGCPFFCNFCSVVNMVEGRWLAQSAQRTSETVRYLVRQWGANAVEFYDNNFFVHEARSAEFAERIRDLGIAWWGESRIDTLLNYSDRSWQLLRDSGLKMVFMGAESGSDEVLKRMDKGGTATVEKTLLMAEKMAVYGVVPEFSFVLGSPPDPETDAAQTLDFIRRVKRCNPSSEIILYLYTPVPLAGSLYEQAKAEGFEFPRTPEEWIGPEWMEFSQRRSVQIPWVSDPLWARIRDFEKVLNAYYPTTTDQRLTGLARIVLRLLSSWRYRFRIYRFPLELRVLQRFLHYQRPETAGF
ncbi:MAG: B12-binding domain-containing radical SAM protein [Acidobacteriota bacterium]